MKPKPCSNIQGPNPVYWPSPPKAWLKAWYQAQVKAEIALATESQAHDTITKTLQIHNTYA